MGQVEELPVGLRAKSGESGHTVLVRHSELAEIDQKRVLFFTGNGHGLGHISRIIAIARHCHSDVAPFMLTLSEAFEIASRFGIPAEYFPARISLELSRRRWEELLRLRLADLLDRIQPSLLVVDHVNPPRVLLEVAACRGTRTMWIRRGLWRSGRYSAVIRYSHLFDHVIEPIDIAGGFDQGATAWLAHHSVSYTRPISLVEPEDMLSREDARRALGLPLGGLVILVNLSADTTESLVRLMIDVRDKVNRHGSECTLFAPTHVLHADRLPVVDGVGMQPVYPLARYLHAFDAAISTSGYNSFHELVLARIPSIFTARNTGSIDDQELRARSAGLGGFGVNIDDIRSLQFHDALEQVLDPVLAHRMRRAAAVAHPGNGASDAAKVVSAVATQDE